MNIYKLKSGISPIREIERIQFERDTQKKKPWYQIQANEISLYAVCPACNNPIQIIALYKRKENSPRPYGKHVPKSIKGLAEYNHETYLGCPYANPNIALKKDSLRSEMDKLSLEILSFMKEQFDRIIYILQEETGIIFTEKLSKDMLVSFLQMHGYQYVGINMCNLPWIFAYMTASQSLFGRILKKDCPLMQILKKQREVTFTTNNQIRGAANTFLEINFAFIGHEFSKSGTDHKETVEFVVSLRDKLIYQVKLAIDPIRFHNLVNVPMERAQRNQKILHIAEELIP